MQPKKAPDFILAYEKKGSQYETKRRIFEENLQIGGVKLDWEKHEKINFVKIFVPDEVLAQYAEILKLRLPIKLEDDEIIDDVNSKSFFTKILDYLNVTLDPTLFPTKNYQLTSEFRRDKIYLFDVDAPNFFDNAIKIRIASYILERTSFGNGEQERGINRLLSEDVYKAAYPLHDDIIEGKNSSRKLLMREWASMSKFYKYQPIDVVKDYFGVKYAIYFTWLGFYTNMLIVPTIVGLLCMVYAATTLNSDHIVKDSCNLGFMMCPLCDQHCDYWNLTTTCTYSKILHFIDNPAMIFFTLFMSIWMTLFLEMWKRYSAEMVHRWGLMGFDLQAEPPRPEYLMKLANAKKKKLNVVTQLHEPVVPFWRVKVPAIILSFSVALFLGFMVIGLVFGVILYRMFMVKSQALFDGAYDIYIIPITCGILNLVSIVLLNFIYDKVAVFLTDLEMMRTQTEYDESLSLKIYMFQFMNFYSSICYIAFFKGKFTGYPAKRNTIFGFRQEECGPGGCLMELTIQLAIIMVGRQAISEVIEMGVPLMKKIIKTIYIAKKFKSTNQTRLSKDTQWAEDFKLNELTSNSLFPEYLEMILQFGFVTIFISAFPLSPFFALLNNIFEMRLDAKKLIEYFRRPVPQRVKDIGIWMKVLEIINRISIVSNAFIIAFSSYFIPQLVYQIEVINKLDNDYGFLNFTLAVFNTSDFPPNIAPQHSKYNVSICRYPDFRNPPSGDPNVNYKRPIIYWHILAARLAFIVVYQNLVTIIVTALEWLIPDISKSLKDQIKREAYKTNEVILNHETFGKRNKYNSPKESSNHEIQLSEINVNTT